MVVVALAVRKSFKHLREISFNFGLLVFEKMVLLNFIRKVFDGMHTKGPISSLLHDLVRLLIGDLTVFVDIVVVKVLIRFIKFFRKPIFHLFHIDLVDDVQDGFIGVVIEVLNIGALDL